MTDEASTHETSAPTSEDLSEDSSAEYESARYQRWVARTHQPLDVLAVVFLVDLLLIWSFPDAPDPWTGIFDGISWFVWGCFALDYLVRLALADRRMAFVRSHKIDLLMVLLPMLRLLRVLLLIRRSLKSVSTERIASSIVSISALIVALSSFLVWRVESAAPNANIHTFGESVWWAVVTVTTVGYGNLYPVTPQGQIIASLLMIVGISLIGTISATVAAYFVKRPDASSEADDATATDPEPTTDATGTLDAVGVAQILARLDVLGAEQTHLRELLERRPL